MLYTLEDVKNMIADFEDVKPEDVEVYDCCSLVLQDAMADNSPTATESANSTSFRNGPQYGRYAVPDNEMSEVVIAIVITFRLDKTSLNTSQYLPDIHHSHS